MLSFTQCNQIISQYVSNLNNNIDTDLVALQSDINFNLSNFEKINQFLQANKSNLIHLSKFNILDASTNNTQGISKLTQLTEKLNLNYKFIEKIYDPKLNDTININNFYMERLSIIELIKILINLNNLPVLSDSIYNFLFQDNTNRINLINDILKTIKIVLSQTNSFINFLEIDNKEFTNNIDMKNKNLTKDQLQSIFSDNIVYIDNLLKLLSNLIININLPIETIKNWFTDEILFSLIKFNSFVLDNCLINNAMTNENILNSFYINLPTDINLISTIQINSILFLNFNTSIQSIDLNGTLFNDLNSINQIIMLMDQNLSIMLNETPLIIYFWSFFLYTKSIILEHNENLSDSTNTNPSLSNNLINSKQQSALLDLDKLTNFDVAQLELLDGLLNNNHDFYLQLSRFFAQFAESNDVLSNLDTICNSLLSFNIEKNNISNNITNSNNFYSVIVSSLLIFLLHFVPINNKLSIIIKKILNLIPIEFKELFLISDSFIEKLNDLKIKLPLVDESLYPLINLTSSLTNFANFQWENLNTYATLLKLNELDYDICDEIDDTDSSDNSNSSENDCIVLKSEILVKPPFEKYSNVLMNIPKNTKGKLLKLSSNENIISNSIINNNNNNTSETTVNSTNLIENNDIMVIFLLNYNGWSFLGRILQNLSYSLHSNVDCDSNIGENFDELNDENLLISIIDLIANLVNPNSVDLETSNAILEKLSNNTEKNENIFDIIFRIYEIALNKRNYNVLIACSNFSNALMVNHSNLIWSYLSRSTLFDRFGKTGLINVILGTIELESGNFEFTLNLSILINLLFNDTININSTITSLKLKKEILNNFTIHFIHIFESCHSWKFNDINQRSQLFLNLINFFNNVLINVYSFEKTSSITSNSMSGGVPPINPKNFDNIITVLTDSSNSILKTFLCTTADAYAANALIEILTSLNNSNLRLLNFNTFSNNYIDLINSSFSFANNLIAIRDLLKFSPSLLEKEIFTNATNFVDMYTELPLLKKNIINLFLYVVNFSWNDEYPFLLSYLGEKYANKLLQILLDDLRSPLKDYDLLNKIFIFVKCSIQSKQDGLAILFLTGRIASKTIDDMKNDEKDKSKISISKTENTITDKSILFALKENVLEMDKLPEVVTCSLLDAITAAFKSWIHTEIVKNDSAFINALMKKFNDFVSNQSIINEVEESNLKITQNTYKCRSISTIVEIFALYLYMIPNVQSPIYKMLNEPNLYSKLKPFFEFENSDWILQDKLMNKFNSTYPKFPLYKFRSIQLSPSDSLSHFDSFNVTLMDKMFAGDICWNGDSKASGLKTDIEKFHLQTQYNFYQISAAKSWGALLTSFINMSKQPLNDEYITIAFNLLQSNIITNSSSNIILQLYQEKIELVFYILYSFQRTKKLIPQHTLTELFKMLLQIFKSSQVDYVANIKNNNKSNNYRSIIRSAIIILDLISSNKEEFMTRVSDEIFEFFELSFCRGVYLIFSNILMNLTNNRTSDSIDVYNFENNIQDLFLLLSLFNKIQQLNPSENFCSVLASSIYEVGTIRVLLNIYSNAHLTKIRDEPLIGHLALSFITELCTIPIIAQKFINNGLFVVLLESPLSFILQNENIRPENLPRLHNVWTNDLLAMMLLLLSNFGKKILPEVCLFVSVFKEQFKNCILSWSDNKLTISSALIRETSQMIMLQSMLEKLNYKNYLKDNRVRSQTSDYIELVYGLDDEMDRKQLSITLNKLLTHPKYLNSRIIAITVEEQLLLKDESTRTAFVQQINKDIKSLQQSLW